MSMQEQNLTKKKWSSIVYDGWLLFAELVGRFNTKVIVSIIYFALVSIAWLVTSTCLKRQLLDRKFRIVEKSAWIEHSQGRKLSVEELRHQF